MNVTLRVVGYKEAISPPYTLIHITFSFPGKNLDSNEVIL